MKAADAEQYLVMYPEIRRKWIVQCIGCQRQGYKPEMTDSARGARNIRRYFGPLQIEAGGLCRDCVAAMDF